MEKERWSASIVIRYTLLQLPGWAFIALVVLVIDEWVDLPAWALPAILAVWIAKDVVLFPLVWRAYDQNPSRIVYRLVGTRARAKEPLAPSGYVQIHGELWQAELLPGEPAVPAGKFVRVRQVRGLTLIVQAIKDGEAVKR